VQKDEPLSMIFEDLNEAVTSLMRLAKPLNDYHLIGDRSQVDESTRSKICAQLLLELEGMFPQTAGYILSRLATSFSDRRIEISTTLRRTQPIHQSNDDEELLRGVYGSLEPVLQRRPAKSLGNLDMENSDGASISSLATGRANSLCHPIFYTDLVRR
jgi:hypothetical protein